MSPLLTSFLLGLAVSLHCAGMCGPLMCAKFSNGGRFVPLHFAVLQMGRVTTYTIMGLVAGFSSSMISLGTQQGRISLIAGILILLIYFVPTKLKRKLSSKLPANPWASAFRMRLGKLMGSQTLGGNYALGLLNGLLPCGVVYVALGASMTAESALMSGAMMTTFGLGNIPVLIFSAGAGRLLSNPKIRSLVLPMAVLMTGSLLILRGMDLGIPYLSPNLEQQTGRVAPCCEH